MKPCTFYISTRVENQATLAAVTYLETMIDELDIRHGKLPFADEELYDPDAVAEYLNEMIWENYPAEIAEQLEVNRIIKL